MRVSDTLFFSCHLLQVGACEQTERTRGKKVLKIDSLLSAVLSLVLTWFDRILNHAGHSTNPINRQHFATPSDLNRHIMNDHRITRMKCPMCLKYFKSATALMAHCESRGARCEINKAEDFNIFLDRISGGFLGVEEKIRPDHLNNPSVLITNEETGRIERYNPPVASYLQYTVTKPPDWKEPVRTKVIGGIPNAQRAPQW
jgi:hypothetical protein